jgi:hypothetical protein
MSEAASEIQRRGRIGLWALLSLALLLAVAAAGVLVVTGRPLVAPGWLVQDVEARVNARLGRLGALHVGGAELVIGQDGLPRVRLSDIRLTGKTGKEIADLPEVRASLSLAALVQGRLAPGTLTVSGARINLRRNANGSFDIGLGHGLGAAPQRVTTIGGVLAEIDQALELPMLAGLKRIRAEALSLSLDDERSHRVWQVGDGRLVLVQDSRQVSIELGFGLANPSGDPARAVLTFISRKSSPEARMSVRVDNVDGADIAAEAPALAFLKVVRAPISGDFRASVGGDGRISGLEGSLDVGKGVVQANPSTPPVKFDSGTMVFRYDPAAQKVDFTELSVQSPSLRVKATAHAYLRDMANGLPQALVGQVKLTQVMVDPKGLFEQPVRFSRGAIDLKLDLEPFNLHLGQLMLMEGPRRILASGDFAATRQGWKVSLDTKLNQISHTDLLALWPVFLVPKTREWLAENVQTGMLFNVNTALRLDPGQAPVLSLGYDFSNADVRFIKTLPPIRAGRGYATIEGKTYTMVVASGHVDAPEGGAVDVAGSVFEVPDIDVKPPPAVVKLKTRSSITAALSLLDQPPFHFLTKAGQPVDLAQGTADLRAVIHLPLADKIELPDVRYDVTGTLHDVKSTKIVKNRVLTAKSLKVAVNNDRITVSGKGKMGVLPADVTWSQGLAPGAGKTSHLSGTVEMSQAFVDEFHIGLPKGAVRGKGTGRITAELTRDGGSFKLTSDLAGVALSLPELGWSKPAARKGQFLAEGRLGQPVQIDRLRLAANGLDATGKVILNRNGTLNVVRLARVKLGGWLDGPVDLVGRGKNGISVVMKGGTIDLRHATFRRSAARGLAVPINLSLDRLTVSQGIVLTRFKGGFTTLGGFNGNFTSQVNGKSQVRGTVVPSADGTAVRIRSDNAGATIAAAGVFDRGRGGRLDLTLIPRKEAGQYDGRLRINNIKVVKAPGLADLLEAISIVGLLEQLNGPGIGFSDVNADFRLTPNAIDVTKGSAIGPSMGISAAGLFNLDTDVFNMQGVISPIYFLNGIGSLLTRQGEGLFGFNYRLRGTSDNPRVSVNPLSILTPGMFRDLFRRPPPSLSKP